MRWMERMVTRFPLPPISLLDFHLKTVNLHWGQDK